jgi:hypothetical protein
MVSWCSLLLPQFAHVLVGGSHLRRLGSHGVGPGRKGLRAAVVPPVNLRESPWVYVSLSSRGRNSSLSPNPCHKVEVPGNSGPRCGVEQASSTASLTHQGPVPGLRLPCWLRWNGAVHACQNLKEACRLEWVPALAPSCCRWGHVSCRPGCYRGATQLLLTQGAGLAHRLQNNKSACAVPGPHPGVS